MPLATPSAPVTPATSRRHVAASVLLCLVSWLLLGVGAISALTPSEGRPGAVEILVFAVLPLLLLSLAARLTTSFPLRVAAFLQLLLQLAILFIVLSATFPSHAPADRPAAPSGVPDTTI
jgi:hypothetical protein